MIGANLSLMQSNTVPHGEFSHTLFQICLNQFLIAVNKILENIILEKPIQKYTIQLLKLLELYLKQ